jgi:hypothetical protein
MAGWTVVAPWRTLGGTGQNITATATSATFTNAVSNQTRAVLLTAKTANVRVEIGPKPTATATSLLIKTTDSPLVIGCSPGDKVAVIQDSSGGVLNLVELTH